VGRLLCLVLLLSLLLASCSGNGKQPNDFDKALQAYETDATQRVTTLSESLAPAYVTEAQSGNKDPTTAVVDQHKDEIADLGEFLCQRLRSLAADAGSGKDKTERMSTAAGVSDRIVRDAMNAALINRALSQPAERRDELLDSMGVKAIGPDGSELRGTDALKDAGLLDSNGALRIPERSSAQYTISIGLAARPEGLRALHWLEKLCVRQTYAR
jgi:hypothetical protein